MGGIAAVKIAVGTRLVCWEPAIVLLSAWFFTWPSGSVCSAPLSVRCVAVRSVMHFFHVCLLPFVISVVSGRFP